MCLDMTISDTEIDCGISGMKHRQLHAIAHNFADSLASGMGFPIGVFMTNVFADAAINSDGSLEVDFLNGTVIGQTRDERLPKAVALYHKQFPAFCQRHGTSSSEFHKLVVRYTYNAPSTGFSVTIQDFRGRASTEEYGVYPSKRVSKIDHLGRRR